MTSLSAFCKTCWSTLSDKELEQEAMKILRQIKTGAHFADET